MSFILILGLFVHLGHALECSPEDLQKRCYVQLCQGNSTNLPSSLVDLESELKAFNFKMPEEQQKKFDRFFALMDKISTNNQELRKNPGSLGLAEEMLKDYPVNDHLIRHYFSRHFLISQDERGPNLILNDVTKTNRPTFEKAGRTLIELKELKQVAQSTFADPQDPKTQAFLESLEDYLASRRDPRLALVQNWKKGQSFTGMELVTNFTSTDFASLMAFASKARLKDISLALEARWKQSDEDRKHMGKVNDQALVQRSCALSSYMLSKYDQASIDRTFQEAKKKLLQNIDDKFLSKLSGPSSATIKGMLASDPFLPLSVNPNIYPDLDAVNERLEFYANSPTALNLLEGFQLISDEEKYMCALGNYLPTDHYVSGTISTSLFTLGLGFEDVLAHEFGHWLSDLTSRGVLSSHSLSKIQSARACLSGFYQEPKKPRNPRSLYQDDKFWTEEDFADWFSALVTTQEAKTHCEFSQLTQLFVDYVTDGKVPAVAPEFLPNNQDTHSSPMFRTLHQMLVRGKTLPQDCQDLLKAYPKDQPRKCEW